MLSNTQILNVSQIVNNIISASNSISSKVISKKDQKVITRNKIAKILKEITKSKKS